MTSDGLAFPLPALIGGRYRVLAPLGRGGIAQVVRARDEKTGADVALKILYPNLRDAPAVADRFRREVDIVRRIEHPHVIRIHDIGDSDGHLYLMMDLYEGGDLADRIAARGPLGVADLVELARQAGGALEAAHRAGVVHRDIKPQNVLVGAGAKLDVRLCDFGLARTADLAGLTTGTTVLGTPEYMAPEVIAEGHADPRSDIYSLGAVLFEAATGRQPFRGDSPFQILRRHLTETPPRARSLAADLPAGIDDALARALAKDPLDRFARAADLVAALEASETAGGVTSLVPAGPTTIAPTPVRPICRRCGGELVAAAGACVDCGAGTLRLQRTANGVAVLVTGPGDVADKIDGRAHVALVKLLDEMPAASANLESLRGSPPRLPFFVADQLDAEVAQQLCDRLKDIGLEARVESRATLTPELRRKVRRMGMRYLAIGASFGGGAWSSFSKHPALLLSMLAVVVMGPFVTLALRYRGPLVKLRAAPDDSDDSERRLARALSRLRRRSDRRLVGRILDRLAAARGFGQGEIAALLSARAADAAEAVAALDHDDGRARGSGDAGAALDRLRAVERDRDALVADLLRTWSRVDGLCVKLARARALDTRADVGASARDVDELRVQIEAEQEIGRLLGGGS